ncbi:MAG: hypothetical protein A2Y77_05890 [Planctomycetes bacterium RBG_13_62_9]|nr:MAG: hypothetical protein A2Y77_05890 [Planctomycetes bacterium RBG_13_62_9]
MLRVTAFSVAVVLFAGSTAFATGAIDQLQNTTIGLGNTIQLLQGQQAANTIQNLAVCNSQFLSRACGAFAEQGLLANLAQIGHASGECAIVGVMQNLSTLGIQTQLIGDCCGPKAQGQNLTLAAGQELVKSEGPGAGSGLHQIVLREDQTAGNTAGAMQQGAAILGLQSSDLSGAACATGSVSSQMCVTTVQSEAAL